MQRLFLLRHGPAETQSPDGSDDARRLTDDGRAQTLNVAGQLQRFAHHPDVILSSPLARAVQTAQIMEQTFDCPMQVASSLAHGRPTELIDELLRRPESVVLAVGHEPTLSRLVEQLCTQGQAGHFVRLQPAGCACLDVSTVTHKGGRATLLWLTTPGVFPGGM